MKKRVKHPHDENPWYLFAGKNKPEPDEEVEFQLGTKPPFKSAAKDLPPSVMLSGEPLFWRMPLAPIASFKPRAKA